MRSTLVDDIRNKIMAYYMTGNGNCSEVKLLEECLEVIQEYQDYRWKIENKGAFLSGKDVVDKAKQTDI